MFTTLDGVVQAPGGEPGFKYTGWSGDYFDDEYLGYKMAELKNTGAILFGRRTFDEMSQAWPNSTDDFGMSEMMNSITKHVVTHHPETLSLAWNNSSVITGDIPAEIRKLKQQSGKQIAVHGSGTMAQTLMQHDLIDEYHLMIHPTALGIGDRLFTNIGERKNFKLTFSKVLSSGTIVLELEPKK
jgi:dihydrofolate reductase